MKTYRLTQEQMDSLRHAASFVAGRVYYSIDKGLPLDGNDAERIMAAHNLLQSVLPHVRPEPEEDQ